DRRPAAPRRHADGARGRTRGGWLELHPPGRPAPATLVSRRRRWSSLIADRRRGNDITAPPTASMPHGGSATRCAAQPVLLVSFPLPAFGCNGPIDAADQPAAGLSALSGVQFHGR